MSVSSFRHFLLAASNSTTLIQMTMMVCLRTIGSTPHETTIRSKIKNLLWDLNDSIHTNICMVLCMLFVSLREFTIKQDSPYERDWMDCTIMIQCGRNLSCFGEYTWFSPWLLGQYVMIRYNSFHTTICFFWILCILSVVLKKDTLKIANFNLQ